MSKNGSCDFGELKQLRDNLKELDAEMDLFIKSCAKELAARLLAKVIKKTPVGVKPNLTAEAARLQAYWNGYQGGTLRRGWTAKTAEEAKSGSSKGAEEYASGLNVNKQGDKFVIEVKNPVEYASYVEFGHRQQKGRYVPALGVKLKKGYVKGNFMLTMSEQEIERTAPAILEKKIEKRLGEWLNGK